MELKIVFDDKTLDVLGKLADRLGCGCVDKSEIVPKATNVRVDESSTEKKEDKKEDKKETAVPVSEVAYSFEQLQACAGKLVQEGKREELFKIIQDMGLVSLPQLQESQYNDFALKLREIGGVL